MLCSKCQTGLDMLNLDSKEPMCTYIGLCNKEKCPHFKPINTNDKTKKTKRNEEL